MSPAGTELRFAIPGGTPAAIVVCIALALVAAWGVYRLRSVADPRRRRILMAARIATATVVALLAIQPQWVSRQVQQVEGSVVVLADVSRSMAVDGGAATRAQRVREVLRSWTENLRRTALYGFGGEVESLDATRLLAEYPATADQTRIERALRQVALEHASAAGAIVLLSDGADSSAAWSPRTLHDLGIKVHTVAVGAEDFSDDTIRAVRADPVAFLRQRAEVEVEIGSSEDQAVPVSLRAGDELVGEVTAQLLDGSARVEIPFTPARLGRAVYTVSIPVRPDDAVPENNERTFLVRVTRDKLRVLLVSGRPSWEARFLRGFLKADPSIDLITFFILRTTTDLTNAPPRELSLIPFPTDELFREHLHSFDVVILQDFAAEPYNMQRHLRRLRDYVMEGGSFALLGGANSFGAADYQNSALGEILPVRLVAGGNVDEQAFRPRVADEMKFHPLVALASAPRASRRAWASLAELVGSNAVTAVKPDAHALLLHPSRRTADGQRMPVMVLGSPGKGRTLALAADSTWRWGITTAGQGGDASAYQRFWDRALRWLARDPLLEPSRVATDRTHYGPGAAVDVEIRIRDERFQPLGEERVQLRVLDLAGTEHGRHEVRTDEEGRGQLRLVAPAQAGAYRLQALAAGDESARADEVFIVEAGGDELADPRARPDVLAEIAEVTGGTFYRSPDDVPSLDELDTVRTRSRGAEVTTPFASPWFYALVVAAFAAEWVLRRQYGLL